MKNLHEKIIELLYSKGVIKTKSDNRFTVQDRELINVCLTIYQMGKASVNTAKIEPPLSLSDQRLIDKIKMLEVEAMQPNASSKLINDLMYYTRQLCYGSNV